MLITFYLPPTPTSQLMGRGNLPEGTKPPRGMTSLRFSGWLSLREEGAKQSLSPSLVGAERIRKQADLKHLTTSLLHHLTTEASTALALGDTAVRATVQPLPQHTAVLVRQKDDVQINITEAAFMARRGRLHRYLGVSLPDRGECKQRLCAARPARLLSRR